MTISTHISGIGKAKAAKYGPLCHRSAFFDNSYGYAVFPTIGKGGIGIGGAFGKGRVYKIWRMLAPAREEGLRLRLGTSRYS